jgi:hypothetical protein
MQNVGYIRIKMIECDCSSALPPDSPLTGSGTEVFDPYVAVTVFESENVPGGWSAYLSGMLSTQRPSVSGKLCQHSVGDGQVAKILGLLKNQKRCYSS